MFKKKWKNGNYEYLDSTDIVHNKKLLADILGDSSIKSSIPTMLSANVNYTTQYCTYKKINDSIIGSVIVRGSIASIISTGYADIDLNINELKNNGYTGWNCFATVQEAYGCTEENIFSAVATDNGLVGLKKESDAGIGAARWKATEQFYIRIGFVYFK